MRNISIGLCVAMFVACAVPALGARIDTVNDVSDKAGSVKNAINPFGLFARYSNERAYVEFSLDSTPATSATLNLYNGWFKATSPVNRTIQIDGGTGGFNEDAVSSAQLIALAAGFVPTTPQSQFPVNNTPQWYALDITDFYNANLGQTITLRIMVVGGTGDGPIFVDHEGTAQTGAFPGGPGYEPHIAWVPEPASLMLLAAGSLLLTRRRR